MTTKIKKQINPIAVTVFFVLLALDAGICLYLYPSLVHILIVAPSGLLLALFAAAAMRIADQWEKGVVLRMGKFTGLKGPGLFFIIPIIDRVDNYIDQRLRVTDVRAERTLTKDTVPVTVDAIVYWTVWDVEKAALEVQEYDIAVSYVL